MGRERKKMGTENRQPLKKKWKIFKKNIWNSDGKPWFRIGNYTVNKSFVNIVSTWLSHQKNIAMFRPLKVGMVKDILKRNTTFLKKLQNTKNQWKQYKYGSTVEPRYIPQKRSPKPQKSRHFRGSDTKEICTDHQFNGLKKAASGNENCSKSKLVTCDLFWGLNLEADYDT